MRCLTTALLAAADTLTQLPSPPEGYHILPDTIKTIPAEYQYPYATENPNIPLYNASLSCDVTWHGVYKTYTLIGYDFTGVTEKMLKKLAKSTSGKMSKWNVHSWKGRECKRVGKDVEICHADAPGWEVSFPLTLDASGKVEGFDHELWWKFNRLTGLYGEEERSVSWVYANANGTDVSETNILREYPEYEGRMFVCEGLSDKIDGRHHPEEKYGPKARFSGEGVSTMMLSGGFCDRILVCV